MAKTRKMILDIGSDELAQILDQVNRLTRAVEALKAGIVTDAATSITNTAAVVTSDFEKLVPSRKIPAGPRFPAK